MMKIFIVARPSTIHMARQAELCCQTLWQSFERSFSISRQALLRMLLLSQTWTILQYALVATVFGRCPYKSVSNFCSSACHEGDFGQCMNNRRVHENIDSDDADHTVRSFWDRFIDLYITMFFNFLEACKSVNNSLSILTFTTN